MTTEAPESTKAQIEALRDLIQSPGWKLYRVLVMAEIAGDFEEHITKALDAQDSMIALDRMRQVAAVRKAGLRWLKLPQERVETLSAQAERKDEVEYSPSRRGAGL